MRLSALLCLTLLAGCAAAPDGGIRSEGAQLVDAEGEGASDGKAREAGEERRAGNRTVTFRGQVRVADPVRILGYGCGGAFLSAFLGTETGLSGEPFDLGDDYGGFTFAFDVAGMEAAFVGPDGRPGSFQASGTVPEGATQVQACNRSAKATEFALVLVGPEGNLPADGPA